MWSPTTLVMTCLVGYCLAVEQQRMGSSQLPEPYPGRGQQLQHQQQLHDNAGDLSAAAALPTPGPPLPHPDPDCYTPDSTPWPRPLHAANGTKSAALSPATLAVTVAWPTGGAQADTQALLQQAVARALDIMANHSVLQPPLPPPPAKHGRRREAMAQLTTLHIAVGNISDFLGDTTNESYALDVTSAEGIVIRADTVFGAMRALESLVQLVELTAPKAWAAGTTRDLNDGGTSAQIRGLPWSIVDAPRFSHRGVLLDTSRHYLPPATLRLFVDAMPTAKLNVLHLHLVRIDIPLAGCLLLAGMFWGQIEGGRIANKEGEVRDKILCTIHTRYHNFLASTMYSVPNSSTSSSRSTPRRSHLPARQLNWVQGLIRRGRCTPRMIFAVSLRTPVTVAFASWWSW